MPHTGLARWLVEASCLAISVVPVGLVLETPTNVCSKTSSTRFHKVAPSGGITRTSTSDKAHPVRSYVGSE